MHEIRPIEIRNDEFAERIKHLNMTAQQQEDLIRRRLRDQELKELLKGNYKRNTLSLAAAKAKMNQLKELGLPYNGHPYGE